MSTKTRRIMAQIYATRLTFGLVFLLCVLAGPGRSEEISLSATFIEKSNGNMVIEFQNTGDRPVAVRSIVINRKEGDPICHLRPFKGFNGELWFARSDSSEEKRAALSMERVDSVTLRFGDEVGAAVYRGCGSILEVAVSTDEGRYMFTRE
ncbi:hypothetical protein [Phaeobacter gallaeciensis]|uniref:hypothetical protein n=1 Tax=Phaeobacter gallaeciensis TaxID=60890 RepID=UPI00237F0A7F|nr:hypothetical protein [Phaeobacter gallaeciensis]